MCENTEKEKGLVPAEVTALTLLMYCVRALTKWKWQSPWCGTEEDI